MLNISQIEKELKSTEKINQEIAFDILQSLCFLASTEPDNNQIQLLLLRVLDRKEEFSGFLEVINGLIQHFGLYPYLDISLLTTKEAIIREIHRPALLNNDIESQDFSNEGVVFHRVQYEVFQHLMNGENVILSAPTSFGKSALIDSLVESKKFQNIIIVVPTIALIDETRRRIFGLNCGYKIITHASQHLEEKNIFILTQERVVDFPNLPNFDIFIIDEFYKLDPRKEEGERAMTLNHAFYKLHKKSKQFYLLGPNIENISEALPEKVNCRFIRTDYATVVTELIRVKTKKKNASNKLIELCNNIQDSTLIYCASPNRAREIANLLIENLTWKGEGLQEASEWVAEHYHEDWTFVKGLKYGIGIHHGKIPRALAHLCIKGFNEGKLPFLICTSTLIEGVNTKAKNVIILDNKIASQKYDFFTFNNIKGRSGRMFKHFIGKVYLFNDPPQESLPLIEMPLFAQNPKNTTESLIIQLDKDDMTDDSWKRVEKYYSEDFLSLETIKSNAGIEPELQVKLAKFLLNNAKIVSSLAWEGYPEYSQLELLCQIIWEFFKKGDPNKLIFTFRVLAFKINQLRNNSISQIILSDLNRYQNQKSTDEIIECVLDFIRNWAQFHFPRLAMAVCRIQNDVANKLGLEKADYSFYCGQVENLFLDPALIALDEYGLPLPLAERLSDRLETESMDIAMDSLLRLDLSELDLSSFEKSLLEDVIKYIDQSRI
ncbi:DEAD/DEAH box helicase [Moraxella sp. ZY21109]|uniref:DEAD/DEAH box helicase n=1 Tax=Moraxella sp. ZY21109 TaxID=2911969 RepID=UPI003D7CE346